MKKMITLICAFFMCINVMYADIGRIGFEEESKYYALTEGMSKVMPNPATTETTLLFFNPNQLVHRIEVYDIIGKQVRLYDQVYDDKQRIDVRDLDAGIYFYFVIGDNQRKSTGRIIIRK